MNIDRASISASLLEVYPDLDDAAAHALIEVARTMEIPAGQKLQTCCCPRREIMWLLKGNARVYRRAADGREVTLYRLAPGNLCMLSLYTLFHGGTLVAEAHSETRLQGIIVPLQDMLALVDREPKIRHLLLKLLTARLNELIELVSTSVLSRLELRLACLLGRRFEQSGSMCVHITHQELANDLGCTREVVSRFLKGFESMGCIRLHRGRIELLSPEQLAHLTEYGD